MTRVTSRAMSDQVRIPAGEFLMGSDRHYRDEGPTRRVTIEGFSIDTTPVTNTSFAEFVHYTGHVAVAEVAPNAEDYPGAQPEDLVPGSLVFTMTPGPVRLDDFRQWWSWIPGADWRHPTGPDSDLTGLENHPVLHVAYEDAFSFAAWAGKELPTEAELEFAARGSLDGAEFTWGEGDPQDTPEPKANTWQGPFPHQNSELDGWTRTSPVGSYEPNGYGLFDMAGNVWEWTSDWYQDRYRRCAGSLLSSFTQPMGSLGSYAWAMSDDLKGRVEASGGEDLSAIRTPEVIDAKSSRRWVERLPTWAKKLVTIGALPEDGEDERLQKASLVLTATLITAMAVVWVVTYASLGLYLSAAIPFTYQLLTIVSLAALARFGHFEVFRTSQLALILILPMFLQWSLGGFVGSSGVLLWALISPLGALVLSPRPMPWFIAYLSLTTISGVVDPLLSPADIPASVSVAFFVANVGGVSVVVYFLLRYFTRGLAVERAKSETLLLNVLPASIARRLKSGERPLADRFEEAAVLFADLVGFTPMSDRLSPDAVVELLDDLFSHFDGMAERRGLEKIKTIGDAYVVVGGVPEPTPSSGEDIADMALEMVSFVVGRPAPNGGNLSVRIGIDIGPVVAGVIGQRKFTYDLWGDTVNTASRMESHGVAGQIQVTPRAYHRLKHQFHFEEREPMHVKGKGELAPFLLIGRVERPTPQPR